MKHKEKTTRATAFHSIVGFTLIEMMVALAVTMVGATAIAQGMTAFSKMYNRYRETLDAQTGWRLGSDLIQPQFSMSGFGLISPSSSRGTDGGAGSHAVDFSNIAGNSISLFGNYNDVYATIIDASSDSLTLHAPPAVDEANSHKELSIWNGPDSFSTGDNVYIAAGRRDPESELSSAIYVWNITDKEDSDKLKIATPDDGVGLNPDLLFSTEAYIDTSNFVLGSEIMKREIEAPQHVDGTPNDTFSLKMTADPELPPIPVVDMVVDVDFLNLTQVQTYMEESGASPTSMPQQWQDTLMLLQINTRTAHEFLAEASTVEYDATGFDVDGDPANGRALVRRGTTPLVFPNNILVSTSLKYHYLDFRYAQVQLYCTQNPSDCP